MAAKRRLLGELLVEWGMVTQSQLDEALAWQREDGRRLGVLLVERGVVKATKLTQILSHQFQLPFVNLDRVRFTPELVATVPVHLARARRVVPICTSGPDVLFVATDDPGDETLVEEAMRACRKEVRLMVAGPDQVQTILDIYYPEAPSVSAPRMPPPPSLLTSEPMGAVRVAVSRHPPASNELGLGDAAATEIVELDDADLEAVSDAPPPADQAIVMVIHASERFAEQCTRAAQAQGLGIALAGLADAARLAAQLRPVALVLMEDVYAMDRVGFTRLSIQTGAHLIIWSDALGIGYLEPVLAAAKQHPHGSGEPSQ